MPSWCKHAGESVMLVLQRLHSINGCAHSLAQWSHVPLCTI